MALTISDWKASVTDTEGNVIQGSGAQVGTRNADGSEAGSWAIALVNFAASLITAAVRYDDAGKEVEALLADLEVVQGELSIAVSDVIGTAKELSLATAQALAGEIGGDPTGLFTVSGEGVLTFTAQPEIGVDASINAADETAGLTGVAAGSAIGRDYTYYTNLHRNVAEAQFHEALDLIAATLESALNGPNGYAQQLLDLDADLVTDQKELDARRKAILGYTDEKGNWVKGTQELTMEDLTRKYQFLLDNYAPTVANFEANLKSLKAQELLDIGLQLLDGEQLQDALDRLEAMTPEERAAAGIDDPEDLGGLAGEMLNQGKEAIRRQLQIVAARDFQIATTKEKAVLDLTEGEAATRFNIGQQISESGKVTGEAIVKSAQSGVRRAGTPMLAIRNVEDEERAKVAREQASSDYQMLTSEMSTRHSVVGARLNAQQNIDDIEAQHLLTDKSLEDKADGVELTFESNYSNAQFSMESWKMQNAVETAAAQARIDSAKVANALEKTQLDVEQTRLTADHVIAEQTVLQNKQDANLRAKTETAAILGSGVTWDTTSGTYSGALTQGQWYGADLDYKAKQVELAQRADRARQTYTNTFTTLKRETLSKYTLAFGRLTHAESDETYLTKNKGNLQLFWTGVPTILGAVRSLITKKYQ
jgi:hypothetical protein